MKINNFLNNSNKQMKKLLEQLKEST